MPVIDELATSKGIRSDVPNQELAKKIAENEDRDGIAELAENLQNKDRGIQSDCIKVMYETGYIKPELIADHTGKFIKLLESKNNRLVWGAMIALSTVAKIKAGTIFENRDIIMKIMENGSVITYEAVIKTIALDASAEEKYRKIIFPYLVECLKNCRPKSVALYTESISEAVTGEYKTQFINTINLRKPSLTDLQNKRVDKLLKRFLS